MKKIILVLAISVSAFFAQAQELTDQQELMQFYQQMGDSIIVLDSVPNRAILVSDSVLNYFFTSGDYGMEANKIVILAWNKKGEKVRIELTKGVQPKIQTQYQKVYYSPIRVE